MIVRAFLAFLLVLLPSVGAQTPGPILQTDAGEFEGVSLEFGEKQVDAFYGVPFAAKPKRFEKPTDPPFLARREAKQQRSGCPQIVSTPTSARFADEDCLHANIFKPRDPHPNGGYPLLLFLHGGAYQVGSSLLYSMPYVAEQYATRGMVYAAIQYRVGMTGLASDGTEEFGGNYALWDVRQAILWFRRNAKALNIDPDRITLWGYSAGASIVGHMALSKQTRDLFAQSIQSSGSTLNEWSFSNASVSTTKTVGRLLNCGEGPGELKKCLQDRPWEELHDAIKRSGIENTGLNSNLFTPRFDGDFFDEDLPLLFDGPPKPTLSTLTENEWILFVIYPVFNSSFYIDAKGRAAFTREKMEEVISQRFITAEQFGDQQAAILAEVMDFYRPADASNADYVALYSHFLSDLLIVVPQLMETKMKTERGWPVFQLLNVHKENLQRSYRQLEPKETTHAFEFPYLFGINFLGDTNFTAADRKFRDHLVDAIVHFAHHGQATPCFDWYSFPPFRSPNATDKHKFVPATPTHPFRFTEVGEETRIVDTAFEEKFSFWTRLSARFRFDFSRGIRTEPPVGGSKHEL